MYYSKWRKNIIKVTFVIPYPRRGFVCASESGSLRACTHEACLGCSYIETRTSKHIPVTVWRIHIGLSFDI